MRLAATARVTAAALLSLLALTGCLRVHSALEIHDDETVSGTVLIAVDENVLGDLARLGVTERVLDQAVANLDLGGHVEPYTQDGYVGRRVRFTALPIARLAEAGIEVSHAGDRYLVTIDVARSFSGFRQDTSGLPPAVADAFEQLTDADIRYEITFPGQVIETNGEADGRTVTWHVGRHDTDPLRAVAWDAPRFPWLWLAGAICLVGLILSLGAVVLVIRMAARRGAQPASPPPPAG